MYWDDVTTIRDRWNNAGMPDDGAYELVPLPEPLRLQVPGRVVSRGSIYALVEAIAAELFERSLDAVATHGDFHLGVSLTPVAEQVLRQLLLDHSTRALPWERTHVWVTDDAPPEGGVESPLEGFAEFLRDHAGVPFEQVRTPDPGAGASAHEQYAGRLAAHLRRQGDHRGFDFALMTVNGEGVVGIAEADPPHAGLTHRAKRGDHEWTCVHRPVFKSTERVALVVPDPAAVSFVKSLAGDPSGKGIRHVSPASQDGLIWYVNADDGSDGTNARRRLRGIQGHGDHS
mgnify:CR=1 FL=1